MPQIVQILFLKDFQLPILSNRLMALRISATDADWMQLPKL